MPISDLLMAYHMHAHPSSEKLGIVTPIPWDVATDRISPERYYVMLLVALIRVIATTTTTTAAVVSSSVGSRSEQRTSS